MMASFREDELLLQRQNSEIAQVEAQIAELQARLVVLVERRDQVAPAITKRKSSAKRMLKKETDKKKALAERKLIKERWLAEMDSGDIAWKKITCLL